MGLLAAAVALVAASAVPSAASARAGRIVVQKTITLEFPAPGEYVGAVYGTRTRFKRNATSGKHHAARQDRGKALAAAMGFCADESIAKQRVKVLHLSTPPFTIGVDKPAEDGSYEVVGAQPPKGDPVKAFQLGLSKRISAGFHRQYRWRVDCKGAQITKPYPY